MKDLGRLLLVLIIAGLILANSSSAQQAGEFQTIKNRFIALFPNYNPDGQVVGDMINNQKEDGSWPDINYQDQTREDGWDAIKHWNNLTDLAMFCKNNPAHHLSSDALGSLSAGLDFWFSKAPRSPNRWHNQMGVPMDIGRIYLIMGDQLSADMIREGIRFMRGIGGDSMYIFANNPATGQNLIWFATIDLMISLLERDTVGMKSVFKTIGNEIIFSEGEGIKYDFGFHQHGPQLYSGAYGLSFMKDVARFMHIVSGTSLAYSEKKEDILISYLLDGHQWMTYKGRFSYHAEGRSISRASSADTKALQKACSYLSILDHSRKTEIIEYLEELQEPGQNTRLTGNKYFWQSDFMVHRRPDYFFSLKMASERVIGSESGNGENLKGYYMGHGVCFIKRTGDEYEGIFPVWNWRQIPGHICQQGSEELPLIQWGNGARGTTTFVGGVSDGEIGFAAYDYRRNKLSAKRAWFFFNDMMVHLVSDIACSERLPVRQTLNQCLLRGDVWYGTEHTKKRLSDDASRLHGVLFVWHDSIMYMFPEATEIEISKKMVTKNWNEIKQGKDVLITREIFNLGVPVGISPDHASLAYGIIPNISPDDHGSTKKFPARIISNTRSLQAVWHPEQKVLQSVFYTPGIVGIPGTPYAISMDREGLCMAQFQDHWLKLSFCDPEHEFTIASISLYKQGRKIRDISVPLYAPPYAGKTVTCWIRLHE